MNRVLQADSIGEPFANWLRTNRTLTVVARYERTLHLQSAGQQLWAITAYPDPGPSRIVVPDLPAWSLGTRVESIRQSLIADGVQLYWQPAAVWDAQVRRRRLTLAERQSAACALAQSLNDWHFRAARGFWNLLGDLWQPLADALRQHDPRALRSICARLIGCGPGLTPTGDDFTQSLLITLVSGDKVDRAVFLELKQVIASLTPLTTRVSQMFLREACRGWAFGSLKAFLEALPEVSLLYLSQVLDVGSTSGPAYVLGVLAGLSYPSFDTP